MQNSFASQHLHTVSAMYFTELMMELLPVSTHNKRQSHSKLYVCSVHCAEQIWLFVSCGIAPHDHIILHNLLLKTAFYVAKVNQQSLI